MAVTLTVKRSTIIYTGIAKVIGKKGDLGERRGAEIAIACIMLMIAFGVVLRAGNNNITPFVYWFLINFQQYNYNIQTSYTSLLDVRSPRKQDELTKRYEWVWV